MFNVKGEDLLWLDTAERPARRRPTGRSTRGSGCPAGPFESVGLWAPPRGRGRRAARSRTSRAGARASQAYYWTVREFVRERFLRFLFAEAEDERSQIADLVARVESFLDQECEDDPEHDATVVFGGYPVRTFDDLCELIETELDDDGSRWKGRLSDATVAAFLRRLRGRRGSG